MSKNKWEWDVERVNILVMSLTSPERSIRELCFCGRKRADFRSKKRAERCESRDVRAFHGDVEGRGRELRQRRPEHRPERWTKPCSSVEVFRSISSVLTFFCLFIIFFFVCRRYVINGSDGHNDRNIETKQTTKPQFFNFKRIHFYYHRISCFLGGYLHETFQLSNLNTITYARNSNVSIIITLYMLVNKKQACEKQQ